MLAEIFSMILNSCKIEIVLTELVLTGRLLYKEIIGNNNNNKNSKALFEGVTQDI